MSLEHLTKGQSDWQTPINAAFDELNNFVNATTVSIDHTNNIVPAVGKLGSLRNQIDMIKVGTTLSILIANIDIVDLPSFNEWQDMTIASIPISFLGGATNAIKMNPDQLVIESQGNNGFSSYNFNLDINTGKINMYSRIRLPHDSGSPTEVGAFGIWLIY